MKAFCTNCGGSFTRFVEKGDRYVPCVCSIKCFKKEIKKIGNRYEGFDLRKAAIKHNNVHVRVNNDPDDTRRSMYEVAFESFLKAQKIRYAYEPYIITFDEVKEWLAYCPDYYLLDHNLFCEVKGIWQNRSLDKIKNYHEKFGNIIVIHYQFLTKVLKSYPRRGHV
jgi:hypothetical protein